MCHSNFLSITPKLITALPLQALLAKLTALLPSHLPSARLTDLTAALQQLCEEALASIVSGVQQRKVGKDQALLGQAERKALQVFKAAVASIDGGCVDAKAAAQACEVSCGCKASLLWDTTIS